MSDKDQELGAPLDEVDDTPKQKEPTEIEKRAIEMGWRPKEEFNGDEADFIDAGEFVRRKPLFDKIEDSSRQIKQLHKALEAFKQHYSSVKEAEYNRALTALKQHRKEALTAGDGDRFEAIDEEIKRVETEASKIQEVQQVEDTPTVHPEFASWTARNPWYNTEKHMRVFADEVGQRFAGRMSPTEVLKEVEKAVKAEFPTKFRNPNKDGAPNVDASSPGKGRKDTFEMTDQERHVMNTLVKGGHMTKEEYIAGLKTVRGIK